MFKSSIKIIVLGFILVGLSGCGAKEKPFSTFHKPEPGKGLLYVYRPSSFVGGGVSYDVKDETNNDKVLGHLSNGAFFKKQITPGEKNLWARTAMFKSETKVSIKEGEVTCIKGTVTPGLLMANPKLEAVDMNTCQIEIQDTVEKLDENINYDEEFFKTKEDLNTSKYKELETITVEKNANMFNTCGTLSGVALSELEQMAKDAGADAVIDLKWDGEKTEKPECSRYWGWYILWPSWFIPGTLDATVSGTPIKFEK